MDDGSLVIKPPSYILVKLSHIDITLPNLPPNVVSIKPTTFTFRKGNNTKITFHQIPAVLAFVIMDFKCQGQTYRNEWAVDLKKPSGPAQSASPYVQLSRGTSLDKLIILRPFDIEELRKPLAKELIAEIELQEEKAKQTEQIYRYRQSMTSRY